MRKIRIVIEYYCPFSRATEKVKIQQVCKLFSQREKSTSSIYLLSPISLIADAGGPMNVSPLASQSCAKSALSERKP